jgi:hypothetical protein
MFWDDEVKPKGAPGPDWIWHGLLARRMTTLLTGHGKSTGKTTLLSMLLTRRGGGGTFARLSVSPGKTIVVSEESREIWDDRLRRYSFCGNVCILPQPFLAIPTLQEWQGLVNRMLGLRDEYGFDLAVIDPLAHFVVSENNARSMLDTLLALRPLTRANMGVLLMHHPGKAETRVGLSGRGSSALLGHIDISIDMRLPRGNPATRRRRFLSLSRYQGTPRQMLLELNPDETDYLPVSEGEGEAAHDDFSAYAQAFQMVLEDAPQKLTRGDILAEWPADFERPSDSTLKRWLGRAVAAKLICSEGTGRKTDPFRYWLPATEQRWREELPFYDVLEKQRLEQKRPWTPLHGPERKSRHDDGLDILRPDAPDDGDADE